MGIPLEKMEWKYWEWDKYSLLLEIFAFLFIWDFILLLD